jgi:hypothetical protein
MTISRNLALHAQYINSSGILSSNAIASNFKGVWSSTTAYAVNDIVSWTNGYYVCKIANTNVIPYDGTRSNTWQLFIQQDLTWRGTWTNTTERYYVNDIVNYNNAIYVCKGDHQYGLFLPTNTSWWTLLASTSPDNFSTFLLMGA